MQEKNIELIKELEKLKEWVNLNNSDIWEPQGFIGNFIETEDLEEYINNRIKDLKESKEIKPDQELKFNYTYQDMLDDLDVRPLGD